MCNFYLMYWVEGDHILQESYCVTQGPPHWHWSNMRGIHDENAPKDASIIPGTDKLLEASQQFMEEAKTIFGDAGRHINEEFLKLVQELQDQMDSEGDAEDYYPDVREDEAGWVDRMYPYQQWPQQGDDNGYYPMYEREQFPEDRPLPY